MKDDDHIPKNPSEDTALEARIVAWVAGEASDFEIAELSRLLVEKPELAVFKKRIETVHNLLDEAARPEKAPLQLSPERRAKLLAALGTPQKNAVANEDVAASHKEENTSVLVYPVSQKRRILWLKGMSVACSVMLTFMILRVTVLAPKPGSAVYPVALPRSQDVLARQFAAERKAQDEIAAPANPEEREGQDAGAAGAGLPAAVTLGAQSVYIPKAASPETAPINEIPIELEPAQVTADTEMNYRASSTLAGARLRTEFPAVQKQTFIDTGSNELLSKNAKDAEYSKKAVRTPLNFGVTSAPDRPASPPRSYVQSEAPTDENRIVLSPFEVTATEDRGSSTATNTLAGTRIRTDLKDAASSVNVVTSEFLRDSGASSEKDLLQSTPAARSTGSHPVVFGASVSDKNSDEPLKAKVSAPESSFNLEEISAGKQSVSTFSLHVGDASFKLAVAALARGERPDPAAIRPEEFYNAFDYSEPAPAMAEKVSCRIEQSAHPELQLRNLLRIAMRVPATGRGAGQPLRLTILLDTSGSMQRDDRAAAVRKAMDVLVSLLSSNDRVTLIGFSRNPRLLAESVPGDQAKGLLKIIAETPAEGGTNLEAALKLAGELAYRQQEISAQNRIILLTDGAANLGDADPAKLANAIVKLRQQGIAFDACGVGLDGLDDHMLEALTRDGDGRYTILSNADSAGADFARQLAGAFRPAAKNVKVQVRFNPARVGHYKLIGFEQHRLKEEDFRNDKIDAAELAADEAAVALYQVEALPQGEGELGEVYVRFQDTSTGNMIERSWTLPYDARARRFDQASPAMQLTGTSALVAEHLQGLPVKLDDLVGPINALRGHYKNEARVQDFVTMFAQLRRLDQGK